MTTYIQRRDKRGTQRVFAQVKGRQVQVDPRYLPQKDNDPRFNKEHADMAIWEKNGKRIRISDSKHGKQYKERGFKRVETAEPVDKTFVYVIE